MSWLLPARARRRILTTAALTGAWGVVTGFALFVLLSPEVGQFGSRAGLRRLALIVAVAVAAASFVERLRDLIREPNEEYGGKRAIGPAVFSVLLLAVFELCVMAYENATERTLQSRYVLQEIAQRVTESAAVTEGYPLLWPEDMHEPDSVLALLVAASHAEEPNPARRFADLLREPDRRVLSRCYAHAGKYLCGDERRGMSIDSYGDVLSFTVTDSTATAADRTRHNPLVESDQRQQIIASLIAPNDTTPRRQFPERGVQVPVVNTPSLFEQALAGTSPSVDSASARDNRQPNDTGPVRDAYDVLLERLNAAPADSTRRHTWRTRTERLLAGVGDRIQWQSGVRAIAPGRFEQRFNPAGLYTAAYTPEPSALLASDLSAALNHVLLRRDVYRSEYFDSLALDSGLRDLLEDVRRSAAGANAPSLQRVVTLNRALLGATFRGPIARDLGSGARKWLDVAALAGLWLVAGVILAFSLSRFVIAARPGMRQEPLRGLVVGIRSGITTALLGLGLYIVAVRSVYLLGGLVADETMGGRLSALYLSDGPLGLRVLMLPVALLQLAWLNGVWGRLLLFAFVVVMVVLWRRRVRWPLVVLAVAIALFAMRPYLTWSAPLVLVLGVVAWGVPGALLGVSAPYLRPSLVPRANWAWLAWTSGILVAAATYWLKGPGWLYGVAALLGALGIAFRLGWQVRQWWPVAALLFGLSLAGATSIVNRATFKGVLGEIRTLNQRANPLSDLAAVDSTSVSNSPLVSLLRQEAIPSWQWRLSRLLEEDEPRRMAQEVQLSQRLEIALLGSLGFWITIALFVAWSERDRQKVVLDGADGRKRCFWSDGALGDYHDHVHGRQPNSDQELFERLALEILDGERALTARARWAATFGDFDIAKLAQSSASATPPVERRRTRLVVENARRFARAADASLGSPPATSGHGPPENPVLARLGIGREAPQRVARAIRRMFVLPRNFAMWTFLQSVGAAPGAHHAGCFAGQESDSTAVAGADAGDHTTPKPPVSA